MRSAAGLPGVSVVSMSFGVPELTMANFASFYGLTLSDLEQYADTNYFSKPGVTFVACSGDDGAPGWYPAFSPNVISVGGTSLQNLDSNGDYPGSGTNGEIGWSDSGGGRSQDEPQPAYQIGVVLASMSTVQGVADRTIPDVSFDADPATGVAVADSFKGTAINKNGATWLVGGGTRATASLFPEFLGVFYSY